MNSLDESMFLQNKCDVSICKIKLILNKAQQSQGWFANLPVRKVLVHQIIQILYTCTAHRVLKSQILMVETNVAVFLFAGDIFNTSTTAGDLA